MNESFTEVERWSRIHAIFLLVGVITYYNTRLIWIVPMICLVSVGYLLISQRELWWDDQKMTSRANVLTLIRHDGILLLVFFSRALDPIYLGIVASVLAILDGFDGYYARKDGNASWFGGYLDKETDAIFVLMMCLVIFDRNLMPWWVLILGIMRYTYVLILPFLKTAGVPEPRSSFGRVNAVVLMVGLIGCFILTFSWYRYVFALVAIATVYSFASSFWYWIRRKKRSSQ